MSIDPSLIAWMVAAERESCFRFDYITIKPRGLSPLQWTSGSGSHMLPDGRVFTEGPGIERDSISLSAGLQSSEMNLTLQVDDSVLINGMTALRFAERGGLDGADVKLEWAYFDEAGVFKGSFVRFSGMCGPAAWSAGSIELIARSATAALNIQVPREVYQPACLNQVFDPKCGLKESDWLVTGAVTSVPVGRSGLMGFTSGLTQPDGYFDLGLLTFISGPLQNVMRTVKRYASGQMAFAIPLPVAPAVGSTFSVLPGCNRALDTCVGRFNNRNAFRATPFVPPAETIA